MRQDDSVKITRDRDWWLRHSRLALSGWLERLAERVHPGPLSPMSREANEMALHMANEMVRVLS